MRSWGLCLDYRKTLDPPDFVPGGKHRTNVRRHGGKNHLTQGVEGWEQLPSVGVLQRRPCTFLMGSVMEELVLVSEYLLLPV